MAGTEIAYAAVGLRACYAMSGTDIPYAGSARVVRGTGAERRYSSLRYLLCHCYAVSGTDVTTRVGVTECAIGHLYKSR
eukprot:3473416-Rhodomonas_salina.2